ncbi:MAG: 2Fe-2S iron-sulfur cluster binding domain-containing protein [Clostridiaceae bacterium]|jgi:Na+-transporting NADH:ubiquinone oxidoreductase subunit F|nr:2Fe-2S iron-sulfur cluster binding domain-containing protein [Clostridiaceae bacterium]
MEIVTTILSISLISVALAILIILAERLLNNYGDCQIDINEGARQVTVPGGSSLLSTLAGQGIFIPSACGGKATCGLCKVQVLDGAGPLLPTEEPYLSGDERQSGFRLSCQVKVKQNLKILIPEELFNIREFKTRIARIDTLTHDIKGLRLELLEPDRIRFKAGQYVQLYTKPYSKVRESVFRAYSMASVPSEDRVVELIVRQVPEGICTTYVHQELKEGDELRISGPYGDFYLRGDCDELVFIAGGSGLAPIRSLILDILEKQLPYKMTFFFGAVTLRDLYYLDYFGELQQKHENFRFVPALSKPTPTDNWQGEIGLITEVVDRFVPDGQNKEAYLCGSPGMINACLNVLQAKGFGPDKIFYDKF